MALPKHVISQGSMISAASKTSMGEIGHGQVVIEFASETQARQEKLFPRLPGMLPISCCCKLEHGSWRIIMNMKNTISFKEAKCT